ncbi:MAG: hypothetical protein ABIS14_03860 [Sphingomonas sp.]
MRLVFFATLSLILVTGCTPNSTDATNQSLDIGGAADAARNDIARYAAGQNERRATLQQAPRTATPPRPAPLRPPAPGTPGGLPDDRTPIAEASATPDSAQGAATIVETYYALLGEGKYSRAWALWDGDGKASGMTTDAFAASFDRYSEYHANIGAPGVVDAGAGQRHVTVPVQVYARLKQGAAPVYLIGSVTLHRTADIDGATAAQRSWHLSSVDLKPGSTNTSH